MTLRLDVDRLFKSIDQMDADEFSSFLTEDGVFTFGNAEPVRGRQAVRDAVAGFFSSIAGLHHHDATTVRSSPSRFTSALPMGTSYGSSGTSPLISR